MSENNDIEMQVKISKLESRLEHLETRFGSFMDELRVELKEIKSNTQIVNQVVNDQTYYKDSLSRAFSRIEKIEDKHDEYDAIIHRWEGARALAWVVWTIMASGLGLLMFKVFFGLN